LGQFMVTRLVSSFLQQHPKVTASLGISNRPLHMIQEGCDVGIQPGKITDENVIARPAGSIRLSLAASPSLLARQPSPRKPADVEKWPWISLAGSHFWGSAEVRVYGRNNAEHLIRISPVLTCEGVTSIREAVRCGLGISVLPDWMIEKDLLSGRLVRVLPTWHAKDLPLHVVYAGQRLLPARASAFIDFAVAYLANETGRPPKA
ncbi:MAG: LysR family transcriptional regulator, partial [Verrucomicrobiaceae bacterium]